MRVFVGRQEELAALEKLCDSQKPEIALVYGTRRAGKSRLLREFALGRDAVFFTAMETSPAENLSRLGALVRARCPNAGKGREPCASYKEALDELAGEAARRRVVLILDDYQFLTSSYKGMNALLRYFIEEKLGGTRLMLVLGVSSMLYAENEFLSEKGEMHGLASTLLKIGPLDFFDSRALLRGFSPQDAAVLYGAAGGVPHYLRGMNDRLSLRDNLVGSFFSTSSALFSEAQDLLRREVREPVFYNAILSAVAGGVTKNAAIAKRVGLQTSACTAYLNSLIALGILVRERPAAEAGQKKTTYSFRDGYLRFWYTFVPPHLDALQRGEGDAVWEAVRPQLGDFMGQTFREISMQWLRRKNAAGSLPVGFSDMGGWWGGGEQTRRKANEIDTLRRWLLRERAMKSLPLDEAGMGRWWGASQTRRGESEIDIVAPTDDNQAIFGMCRWRDEPVDMEVLLELEALCAPFDYLAKHLFLFSKSGFTPECAREAAKRGNVTLIGYDRMADLR